MRSICIVLLLLFVLECNAQNEPEISTENYFNQPALIRKAGISKEFIYVFLIKKEKLIDSAIAAMIIYDTLGNITKYERYDAPLVGQVRYDYSYNEKGLVSKILATRPKNQNSTIEFMYDSVGNEIVRSTNNKYTSFLEWKEYDDRGRLIKQYDKFNSGKRYLAFQNTWSSNNLLISKQGFDQFGKSSYTESYKYSNDSLRIQKFFANKFITKLETETIYNTASQMIMNIKYQDDTEYHTDYSYTYNENGTVKEWSASFRNKLIYRKSHRYYFFD